MAPWADWVGTEGGDRALLVRVNPRGPSAFELIFHNISYANDGSNPAHAPSSRTSMRTWRLPACWRISSTRPRSAAGSCSRQAAQASVAVTDRGRTTGTDGKGAETNGGERRKLV